MANDLQKLLSKKSDKELQVYIDKRKTFTTEAVEFAITEFKTRGRVFSAEELDTYQKELEQRKELKQKEDDKFWNSGNKNVVTDENAPAYYSEQAIYLFSIFFSMIFGAVLLANNLRNTETKKGVPQVVIFGIAYTSLQMFILSVLPSNTIMTFFFSGAGALLMNYIFWKKFIGKDTKYRKKPIWKPLIIGIIIFTPIIISIIYGGKEY